MPGFRTRRFWRDTDGAISIVAAISLFFLLALAAIVIDIGSLYFQRRNLQAATDAAALAAVQNPANAMAVATDVFSRNGYSDETLTVTPGVYAADESLSAAARFTPQSDSADAIRVSATRPQHTYLATLFGLGSSATLAATATAARLPTISFGAGTRLASLDNGIANALLGQMLGSSINLSAIDYNALLTTNVDALTFLNNLAAIVNVSGSYQQLAASNVSMGQIMEAMAQTLDTSGAASGDPANAALALQGLGTPTNVTTAPLSQFVDLSPLAGRSIGGIGEINGTGAQFNVMSILSAGARTVAQGHLIDLGTSLGSTITTHLTIGSPMAQIANGQVGSSIHTAQIRMSLTVNVLNLLTIPLYLEAASGQATVTALPCRPGGTLAEIDASSGLATLQFGSVSDAQLENFSIPVTPTASPLVSGSPISIGATGPTSLSFSQADIDAGVIKSVSANTAIFASLSTNFRLNLSGLLAALLGTLTSTATGLISQLDGPVNNLLTALGLQLGTMDVRVFGASCRTPTLVG